MSAAKRTRWHYSGDVNIEHGGMFYNLSTFGEGYVSVVRCQPCTDAGGPDNCFWVEQLTANVCNTDMPFAGVGDTVRARRAHRALHSHGGGGAERNTQRIEEALITCGWDLLLDEWDKLTVARCRHAIVEACVGYGLYDQESSEMVSLGKPKTSYREGEWYPDKVLRANASLRNYVRKQCG